MDAPGSVGWFYCCLHPAERTVMRQTIEGLVLTLFLGVPLDVWTAFWLVTEHGAPEYQDAFRGLYHLEIVTIESDPAPIEVVRPIEGFLPFWVEVGLFVVTPEAACLSGCTQSRRPAP